MKRYNEGDLPEFNIGDWVYGVVRLESSGKILRIIFGPLEDMTLADGEVVYGVRHVRGVSSTRKVFASFKQAWNCARELAKGDEK